MFAEAYQIVSNYTFPVLISSRFYDGTVESGIGSFVILNDEGWILTAAHVLGGLQTSQQHAALIQNYQNSLTTQVPDPKWITNHSLWFGADQHFIQTYHLLPENDLAIGKIENYDPNFVKQYPVLKNPAGILPGRSLCKLGYPFYDVKATFQAEHNNFSFDPSIFPIPSFPIEGIMTRNFITGKSADGKFEYKWLESSSPGLRGQSGGPTFDKEGKLWAIQSQTRHMPLGFSPKIVKDNHEVEENQFLNVGWGVHIETIIGLLNLHGVKFRMD